MGGQRIRLVVGKMKKEKEMRENFLAISRDWQFQSQLQKVDFVADSEIIDPYL